MISKNHFTVGPFCLAEDYYYDRETHLWVMLTGGERARCGLDPLASETSGDIVAVSFEPVGTRVERGGAFGNLEAAKFVGPLISPVSGSISVRNEGVIANPTLLNQDSLEHWLVELELEDAEPELTELLFGKEQVTGWFEGEIERFKETGMIAE